MKFLFVFIIACLSIFPSNASETSNWKKIGSEDQITIYAKKAKNGILPFKAIGNIEAEINEVLLILTNHRQKNLWAPKLEKVSMHSEFPQTNEYIFSEYYKTPWPATDREFLLKGKIIRESNDVISLKAFSVEDNLEYSSFKSPNHIQAKVNYLNLKLIRLSSNETQIQFEFHGDMKGWMPNWLTNLIQKKWPLRFIQGLREFHRLKDKPLLSKR